MATPLFELDLRERKFKLHSDAGQTEEVPMPDGLLDQDTNIERFTLDGRFSELRIGVSGGEEAVVELRRPDQSLEDLRAERPAVYLDQNQWSYLAAVRFGHRDISAEHVDAAERLAELVEAKKVLLPMSAAHLVETTPLYGESRIALATTVLQLSRGWQMRNPLHIRVDEICGMVEGPPPLIDDPFAPQAEGFFGLETSERIGDNAGYLAYLNSVGPRILATYETLVDPERIPDEGGVAKAAAEGWANKWAGLAAQLYAAGEPAEMVRRVAHGNLIWDMIDDVRRVAEQVGISSEEVINRLTTPEDPISQMPFLAQMRQQLFARLRNHGQKWESNDLVDIVFLTCASGYADILVGERRTIGYLRQARTPPPKARLARNLSEAIYLLERV